MTTPSLVDLVKTMLAQGGPSKPIGAGAADQRDPHFFLIRRFLDQVDLLVIFNSRRCRYQCHFCDLPAKSTRTEISAEDLEEQFARVLAKTKHGLSVVSRLTLSNEGSVFDDPTFPSPALREICRAAAQLPTLGVVSLETRLEFVTKNAIQEIKDVVGNKRIDILTGFETLDQQIRDEVLFKRESLSVFLSGLDLLGEQGLSLTSYVLFKPDYTMSDEEAIDEARASIEFLHRQTSGRDIPLTLRINPMYAARRTAWSDNALSCSFYRPPRLTDVLSVAKEARSSGIPTYVGLSTEGLADEGRTYRAREDFTRDLLKEVIHFNEVRS
ncbi:MAG: radical SAM protein [Acidimicrobiales bacterium]